MKDTCHLSGLIWLDSTIFFVVYSSGKFPIITFEEFISIALDAPRVVGIYPEIKNPVFINQRVSSFLHKLLLKMAIQRRMWLHHNWLSLNRVDYFFSSLQKIYVSEPTSDDFYNTSDIPWAVALIVLVKMLKNFSPLIIILILFWEVSDCWYSLNCLKKKFTLKLH